MTAPSTDIGTRPVQVGRARVVVGLRWGMLDVLVQQVERFAITVVLTRLVPPSEFGVLGMALVFTQLAALVADAGFGPALVQRDDIDRDHVRTATTLSLVVGSLLTVVTMAFAPLVARFYDEPRLTAVLLALAPVYVLRSIGSVPKELLRRRQDFRWYALTNGAALALAGVVGIAAAASGAGVGALVASTLVESCLGPLLVATCAWRVTSWRPALGCSRAALRDIGRFGASVTGTRIAHYGATNVDNLIVGKVLGATALGLYNLAYRLMLFPILRVADVVANVTMPALARERNDPSALVASFRSALVAVSAVCTPVSVWTAAAAPALVPAVFGDRWLAAVPVVQVLALNGARLAIARLDGAAYEAIGRPHIDFFMVAATFVAYVAAFLIGVRWGIVGVAWGYTVAGYALLPLDQLLVSRALGTSLRTTATWLAPGLVAVAAMAVASTVAMAATSSVVPAGRALAALAVGAATYALCLRAIGQRTLGCLRSVLRRDGTAAAGAQP